MVEAMIIAISRYRDTYVTDYDRQEEFKARTALDQSANDAWKQLRERQSADAARVASLVGMPPVVEDDVPDPATADLWEVGAHRLMYDLPQVTTWLPAPISNRDTAQFARWLGLEAEGKGEPQLGGRRQRRLGHRAHCSRQALERGLWPRGR